MITLNYYNALTKAVLQNGITDEQIKNTYDIKKAINNLFIKPKHDMLGWLELPDQSQELIDDIIQTAKEINKSFKNFVVLGIGGSALGTKAIFSALPRKTKTNCYVCDNIDPDGFLSLINALDLKRTCFNVISKSGGTTETVAQLSIILNMFEKIGLKNFSKNIIITTENDSKLFAFASVHNIKTLPVLKSVGGRFSVLSPVGLLPSAVYGVNIKKLLAGAKDMLLTSTGNDVYKNMPLMFAIISMLQYQNNKKDQLVLFAYSDKLSLFVDFFIQLWSESLGKAIDNKKQLVNVGQTPIKAIGTTDQHSQMQLFQEGPNNKLILFLTTKLSKTNHVITQNKLTNFSYLNWVSLKDLLDAEQTATAFALAKDGRPNLTLELGEVNEETLGEFIMFAQLATAFAGEFLNINTYNQPGVESSKIYTMAQIDAPGYEAKKKEITEHTEKAKKYTV